MTTPVVLLEEELLELELEDDDEELLELLLDELELDELLELELEDELLEEEVEPEEPDELEELEPGSSGSIPALVQPWNARAATMIMGEAKFFMEPSYT